MLKIFNSQKWNTQTEAFPLRFSGGPVGYLSFQWWAILNFIDINVNIITEFSIKRVLQFFFL